MVARFVVGHILVVIGKIGGAKYQVAMNVIFICVRRQHIFIFALQYLVGKLSANAVRFFVRHFAGIE